MALTIKYIDNRLTTGANDGSSPANAYRSLEAFRAGSGAAVIDIVQFVAGSGPYREVTSTVKTGIRTDISFDAGTRTISTVAGNFVSNGFQAGDIIRVMGSVSNDRQFTVATVLATAMTVSTTNIVTTESAGASINIASPTRGSSRAVLDPGGNGYVTRPRRWLFNGCELDAGLPLDLAHGYRWKASAAKPGEWYVQRSDESNPSLVRVYSGTMDGIFVNDAADLDPKMGTVGSLAGLEVWGWGDNDGLGYSTLYVLSPTNPEGKKVHVGQAITCIGTSWEFHSWEDGVFSYANKDATTSGMAVKNGGASRWWVKRCIAKYCTFHGFQGGELRAESCLTYFTGHRGYAQAGASPMELYNCVDYRSHLFLLIDSLSTATITVRNCISAENEAGIFDKKGAGSTLIEDHNIWYPRFGASGAALGYISTANWPTTHATDYPPSADTTISTQAANLAAGAVDPLLQAPADPFSSAAQFRSLREYGAGAIIFFIRDFNGRRFSRSSRGIITL